MKRLSLLLAVATLAASCSSAAETVDSSETADSSQPTANSQTTAAIGSTTTGDSIGDDGEMLVPSPTIPPDAPPAPDFTMALADGESFTLSEQAMPVYMIFWADW